MLEIMKNYFVIIPIILLIIDLILIIKIIKQKNKYLETKGIITGFHENTSEIRLNSYDAKAISPIISFKVDNIQYEFIGNYYSTNMKKGDNINIIYDPINPKKAKIKKGLYLATTILSIFTISTFIVLIIIKLI